MPHEVIMPEQSTVNESSGGHENDDASGMQNGGTHEEGTHEEGTHEEGTHEDNDGATTSAAYTEPDGDLDSLPITNDEINFTIPVSSTEAPAVTDAPATRSGTPATLSFEDSGWHFSTTNGSTAHTAAAPLRPLPASLRSLEDIFNTSALRNLVDISLQAASAAPSASPPPPSSPPSRHSE